MLIDISQIGWSDRRIKNTLHNKTMKIPPWTVSNELLGRRGGGLGGGVDAEKLKLALWDPNPRPQLP